MKNPITISVTAALAGAVVLAACGIVEPASVKSESAAQPPAQGPLGAVTATVETGDELHFVRPQEVSKAVLVLKNTGATLVRATLAVGLKERSSATVPLVAAGAINIPPGGEVRRPLTSQQIGPRLGIKYVDWQLSQGGQSASGHASFAVLNPVGVTPGVSKGFVFGNAGLRHSWSPEQKQRVIRAATMVGAESVRADTDWNNVQPRPDQWNWKPLDETVALLDKYGAEWQNLVAYGGLEWTKSPETTQLIKERGDEKQQWRYPPRMDAWRPWVRAQAQRYKGRVRFYEIWNEPDFPFWKGTPEQYLELLKASYQEIKAVDPNAIVMTGGFASMIHRLNNPKVLELTLSEGKPYFDMLAYHKHSSFRTLREEVEDRLLPLMRKYNVTKPLYFNETAMSRNYEREYDQAVELPKRLALVWARGARGYHYFNIWNRAGESGSAAGYNMVNADFSPRPVWVAYNGMARVLRGRQFSHELKLGQGRWGFAFNGKGDFSGDDARTTPWSRGRRTPFSRRADGAQRRRGSHGARGGPDGQQHHAAGQCGPRDLQRVARAAVSGDRERRGQAAAAGRAARSRAARRGGSGRHADFDGAAAQPARHAADGAPDVGRARAALDPRAADA